MGTIISIENNAVDQLLTELSARTADLSPVLLAIGEDIMERTKDRFSTSTSPDGSPWASNSQVTLMRYLNKRKGAFSDKTGKISAKGQKLAINKKPLIDSGSLARQFHVALDGGGNGVVVGSSMVYAAMQQFGGTKKQFPNLWGDIPARPFLPVTSNGELYPQEQEMIVEMLSEYLTL